MDLAARVGVSKQAVGPLVDDLEAMGVVERAIGRQTVERLQAGVEAARAAVEAGALVPGGGPDRRRRR